MWVNELIHLIEQNKTDRFYDWQQWKTLRMEVLCLDHYECQHCKAEGRYRRASIVHHKKHVKDRPDLALSIWDGDERQLVSLCLECHRREHPEQQRKRRVFNQPVSVERWD